MVHSCHQPEVHAMFANKLIQGSKLKKLLTYAPKTRRQNALVKCMGENYADKNNVDKAY